MKRHILLVDDDEDELIFFEDALSRIPGENEFRCTYAGSGAHALEIIKYVTPDYIFVDFNMPGMDGLEFLFRLKEETNLHNTDIYLHSMKITDTTYRAAMLAGASGCIKKGNSIQELINELVPVLVVRPKPLFKFLKREKR